MNIHTVIMAGGAGTRFWPFSTKERPKQFLNLNGEGTMLELTVKRLGGLVDTDHVWVLTNESYVDLVKEQVPALKSEHVVGEPMLRDTSAAIALGAGLIEAEDPGSVMVVLPADHIITDTDGFVATLKRAVDLAEENRFVTIGITPTYPAETFGYLEKGAAIEGHESSYQLEAFIEKPNREKAEAYLSSGNYAWNAGMFVWPTAELIKALETHLPEHAAMAKFLGEKRKESNWRDLARDAFDPLEKISIDFGLMEKLDQISMVDAAFDWNDVGGWLALQELIDADDLGNTLQGIVVHNDCHDNIMVQEEGSAPLVVSGIRNTVVVSAKEGVLVCSKDEVERIKALVQQLAK